MHNPLGDTQHSSFYCGEVRLDNNGQITGYNVKYALLQGLPENYFTDSTITKQFILYINSPESTAIKSKLNLPTSVPYKYSKAGVDYTGTVQVIVMAVNV